MKKQGFKGHHREHVLNALKGKKKINKIPKKWRGAKSYCDKLTDQAVLCLFANGWSASPTGNHTHNVDFLHFHRGEFKTYNIPLYEKYFRISKKLSDDPYNSKISDEHWLISQEVYDRG